MAGGFADDSEDLETPGPQKAKQTAKGQGQGQGKKSGPAKPGSDKGPARVPEAPRPDGPKPDEPGADEQVSPTVPVPPCRATPFINAKTGRPIPPGLGLLEAPARMSYGREMFSGKPQIPTCSLARGDVRIPVLLVDFADYEPTKDDRFGELFSDYFPTSPDDYEAFLNSSDQPGPRKVLMESSGSLFRPKFEVYGWIRGSRSGSYLKSIANYHSRDSEGDWTCNSEPLVLDALRDAIAFHGLNLDGYDADENGILDGLAVVVEGAEPCAHATYLSTIDEEGKITLVETNRLVPVSDPNYAKFRNQRVSPNRFVYIFEKWLGHQFGFQWAHEVGHMLLGLEDYYPIHSEDTSNLYPWTLTSGQMISHLSAWEKAVFGHWIEPNLVTRSATVTIDANETPDGSKYGGPHRLLYKIILGGDEYHYLTVESRWWNRDGNTGLTPFLARNGVTESGLVIFESNWHVLRYSTTESQVLRHGPARSLYPAGDPRLVAYQPGERFEKCWETKCVTIEALDPPGAQMRVKIDIRVR